MKRTAALLMILVLLPLLATTAEETGDLIAKLCLILPLLVELCLQTAGVWEIGKTGVMALPAAIERVVVYRSEMNGKPLYAEIVPRQGKEMIFDGRVLDAKGNVYLEMEGYHTTQFSKLGEKSLLVPLRQVVQD